MMTPKISDFGFRISELLLSARKGLRESREENPKSEIRNPKFHLLGGNA
jgi:hypothetical protein